MTQLDWDLHTFRSSTIPCSTPITMLRGASSLNQTGAHLGEGLGQELGSTFHKEAKLKRTLVLSCSFAIKILHMKMQYQVGAFNPSKEKKT